MYTVCSIEYHLGYFLEYLIEYPMYVIPHLYTLYEIWCYPAFSESDFSERRFDSNKFSLTTPFGKVDAVEPPLLIVRTCNGYHSGSLAPFV